MASLGLVLYVTFVLLMSFPFIPTNASNDTKVYMVYMGDIPSNSSSLPKSHHHNILEQVIDSSSVEDYLARSYGRSFNGFAAKLIKSERDKLIGMDGEISVFTNSVLEPHFMGFGKNIKHLPEVESNIILGVIDSGIWPESKSFTDEGFGPIPKKWKGTCAGGFNFTCNKKLIGARHYIEDSARDITGHGSHTASTAAGNRLEKQSFHGLASGTIRGVLPSARIAVYKVCKVSCHVDAVLAAFKDAVSDGVDMITVSIAGTPYSFNEDVLSLGSFYAMKKGILTVAAAGNNGPSPGRVTNVAPWMLTVAASTLKSESDEDNDAPIVASFSSRGPNAILSDILKPDITAPGVNILAAHSPAASGVKGESVDYEFMSGTSVACPYVAGLAAYVKTLRPDWSPSAIKSAIMTTAWEMKASENKGAEFGFGSGHVNPTKAADPGLVYDITEEEYLNMLCSLNYTSLGIATIAGRAFPCFQKFKLNARDLNYPSMAAKVSESSSSSDITFSRTVTNVGKAGSTYKAQLVSVDPKLSIKVEPDMLFFYSLGEKKSFTVTISVKDLPGHAAASLVWSDGSYIVRSPIVIYS